MKGEGKIKTALICVLAIGVMLISVGAITYAYFSKSNVVGNISISSNDKFTDSIVYNSGANITGTIVPSVSKDENALSTMIMVNASTSDVIASLMAQVDVANTTFLRSSGNAIMYEVYKKNSNTDNTSSATCTDNSYSCGETTCYCTTGSFTNHLDGEPFALITDASLLQGNNYYDIYIWVDGNNSGNEVSEKTLKTNFFFMSTSQNITIE